MSSKYFAGINGSKFTINNVTQNDSIYFACYENRNRTLVQATFYLYYLSNLLVSLNLE